MRDEDYARLLEDLERELLAGAGPAGVLGLTPVTLRLLASLPTATRTRWSTCTSAWPMPPGWTCPGWWPSSACSRAAPPCSCRG
jgi:hypothetical protein